MRIDKTDYIIVQELSKQPVINISKVARKLNFNTETVRYRLNRLIEKKRLMIFPNYDYTKMGLRQLLLFIHAHPSKVSKVPQYLDPIPYWIEKAKIYGQYHGFKYQFLLPEVGTALSDLLGLLEDLKKEAVIKQYTIIEVHNETWFAGSNYEVSSEDVEYLKAKIGGTGRPRAADGGRRRKVKVDLVDVQFIEHYMADATKKLVDIAQEIGITPQLLNYHIKQHIMKKKMIKGLNAIITPPYEKWSILSIMLTLKADIVEKIEQGLVERDICSRLYYPDGREKLVVDFIFKPESAVEILSFIEYLAEKDKVEEFSYVISRIDQTTYRPISAKLYNGREWVWDIKQYVR